jgi:hypothetical protein
MCPPSPKPNPPPAPAPIPAPPPQVQTVNTSQATTQQKAPTIARERDAKTNEQIETGANRNMASEVARKRQGRGSLRIPLASLGYGSGLNFPSS